MEHLYPVDFWTFVHMASGVVAAKAGVPPAVAIGGAVAYEMIEGEIWPIVSGRESRENNINRVTDVIVFGIAYGLAKCD